MPTPPTIDIQNLHHSFGKGNLQIPVLKDINLQISASEIVILTGPSGSGKTTLLTLIGALRSMQTGSLKVLDRQLLGAKQTQLVQTRSNIGYIFQAHNLLKSLTAWENVTMPLKLHPHIKDRQTRAIAALSAVGLGDRTHYYPDLLSGGQKQRVAIARALVAQPQLILADEPTAALDSKSGREVVTLMQKLAQDRNCTILMVTHDNRILDVADRIIHMEDGCLVSDKTT
ncbi:DevA family ABC transporter ATP-binding protein [Chamaesiphon sp. OTE_75_metabat_556]|uniref:DevA family ABC transporter ATP-binding protein n=1 Tax=Chamaesiphon sp. OTE_75_metabat_556 TaxID=2964692 RepID=UPI00286B09CB|nr:DevA family ABC transporter ATP-binding protein [Chamaesiphon sp. OTE_75_metabat_556]